jgi:nitrogen-specific signal transduction histidine kinase
MKRRLDALTRIGRIQALMHEVGRSRLHSLERQQAGLNEDLKAAFVTLEASEIAYGAHAGLVARSVRALQARLDQAARDQETARRAALAHGTRAKLAELAIEAAALSRQRLNERKELIELIEWTIARGRASST